MVCSFPHSHVFCPSSLNPHFCIRDLHRPVPVRRRFRLDQVGHVSLEPGGSDSLGLNESLCGVVWRWLDQRVSLRVRALPSRGSTEWRKLGLDFSLFLAGSCSYRGCRGSFSCLSFSSWDETARLICGGAIPHNKYRSSTLVGLRHPEMALHAAFRAGSIFEACDDLPHGITRLTRYLQVWIVNTSYSLKVIRLRQVIRTFVRTLYILCTLMVYYFTDASCFFLMVSLSNVYRGTMEMSRSFSYCSENSFIEITIGCGVE